MNSEIDYDLVVIGSGPGGQKAAVQGAKAGQRVGLVERERQVGGACVYQGTIPSKTLREAALAIMQLKRSASVFNVTVRDDLEIVTLMERLDRVLKAHTRFISEHLEANGIATHHGRARLVDTEHVDVVSVRGGVQTLRAKNIVLATGSRPRTPANIPVDHEHILDSDSILSMIYLPRSLTVLGGGVIASEYASIFSLLGVKVTVIDKAPRPLMFLDSELTGKFIDHFRRHGGEYKGNQQITSVRWDGVSQVVTELESGEVIKSDKMLVALGRCANLEGLGLDAVRIELTPRGHIAVNENYQTSIPSIYAVGDVIGLPSLASCSMEQGRRAVCHALGQDPCQAFNLVPMGIYAVPEIACVGMSEQEAREKHGDVVVGRATFDELARGQISGTTDGLLKMVADGEGKKLLGVQIVGDGATDLIHVGELALLNDNDVSVFRENVLNFPTLGEAYRVAALNLLNVAREKSRKAGKAVLPLAA